MPLSDITRKDARSDVYSVLGNIPTNELVPEEVNRYLNRGQFDFFNRMGDLVSKWYGTKQTVSVTAIAGEITEIALTGNYGAEKISEITKFIQSDGTGFDLFEFEKLDRMLGDSNYDYTYGYAWYGESLHVFVGASATALSNDSSVLYFVRKPDEMGGDNSVWTITVNQYSDKTDGDQIIIDGVVLEQRAATTEKATFVSETSNNATAQNIDDLIGNVFGSTSGVTVSVSSAVVTITGAKSVTVSQTTSTFLTLAATTAAMVDVPTEYVDLVIMAAQAKAMAKLRMVNERQTMEGALAGRFADIHALFGESVQIKQLEKQPGIQTPRGE